MLTQEGISGYEEIPVATSKLIRKLTWQGTADESAWSRGQSWGFYGFAMMYRFTKDQRYLTQAKKIEQFIFSHPNLPTDFVPYWDFNAPVFQTY